MVKINKENFNKSVDLLSEWAKTQNDKSNLKIYPIALEFISDELNSKGRVRELYGQEVVYLPFNDKYKNNRYYAMPGNDICITIRGIFRLINGKDIFIDSDVFDIKKSNIDVPDIIKESAKLMGESGFGDIFIFDAEHLVDEGLTEHELKFYISALCDNDLSGYLCKDDESLFNSTEVDWEKMLYIHNN